MGQVVDLEESFPNWPFARRSGHVTMFDFALMAGAAFGPALEALAHLHGEETLFVYVATESDSEYRQQFGRFPAFTMAVGDVGESYGAFLYDDPGNPSVAGHLVYSATSLMVTGESRLWAAYGQEDWELGILLTPSNSETGAISEMAVSAERIQAGEILPPEGWGAGVTATDLEVLLGHIRDAGTQL